MTNTHHKHSKVSRRRFAVILHDLAMACAAWLLAYGIRYSIDAEGVEWQGALMALPVVVLVQGMVYRWTRLYHGLWRFASLPDLWNIFRAVAVGTLAIALALFLINRLGGVPRSTLLLCPAGLILLLGLPRLAYRMWKDHGLRLDVAADAKRVLVLGAGRAGETLVRDMLRDKEHRIIGFLDDNQRLKGTKVHGMPVLGGIGDIQQVVAKHSVDVVIIAMPSATAAQMQRVVELCEAAEAPFRTLPRLQDLMAGRSALTELRDVAIDDLLSREPVKLDWRSITSGLAGKVVLVSGGGGSIGSELCRQIARIGPAKLVVVERCEFNLYSIELELRDRCSDLLLHSVLADICDAGAVDRVLAQHKPDVIFHAAAYKHVPMLQSQPREAIRNNVLGTRTLALAADRQGCKTFVMVSTDKAVNPANVMGASKRAAEIFCQTLDRHSQTCFITVRFGNVLDSAGSVVPLFRRQIEAGGPVTVTHPDIERYFMTIPEAAQLILQSAVIGGGGEIFVLDMGKSVKIRYLAQQMIRLSGKVPGRDVDIVYTGLRPGEKLYEELFHDQENLVSTDHDKIFLARCRCVQWEHVERLLDEMEHACSVCDDRALQVILKKLVPEMHSLETTDNNVIPFEKVTTQL